MRRCLLVLVAAFVAAAGRGPGAGGAAHQRVRRPDDERQPDPVHGAARRRPRVPRHRQRRRRGRPAPEGLRRIAARGVGDPPAGSAVGQRRPLPARRAEPRLGRSADGPDDTAVLRTDRRHLGKARVRGDAAGSSRLGRLMWHARLTGGRPRRMPERLHPPRRRALRGPRHPVRDRPARRRRRRRPEPHRRDRRVLRRRRLARAGHAEEPDHERRRHAQPVADARRARRCTSPPRRP